MLLVRCGCFRLSVLEQTITSGVIKMEDDEFPAGFSKEMLKNMLREQRE